MLRFCSLAAAMAVSALSVTSFAATAPTSGPTNSITITNASGAPISNYPFQFGRPFLDGAIANQPQVLINGQPVATQADVKNRYPDGSVEFAVIAVVIPSLPASGSSTLTFQNQTMGNNTPLTQAQMLDPSYGFVGELTLMSTTGAIGPVGPRAMLQNGDYKLWTSGPVAQTIELADDTTARKYDIGFGDGYHPFRPRFFATFWPATHQVFVRAVGENGLSTEIEDLAYKLNLSMDGQKVYSADLTGTQAANPKLHWAGSRWTRRFWIGGTPSAQVNIDNNLAYLESTRFLPNFDTSITVSPTAVAAEYASYAQNANDIYDGSWDQPTNSTTWQSAMPSTGARQDIAPYPAWTALWLYTGDWRMRQVALGLADQAASWPMHVRETDPTKRFLITDPTGVTPASGFGLPISHADRQSAFGQLTTGGNGLFNWGKAADNLKAVSASVDKGDPWGWDGAHQAQAFYPQYILTGDPFYLEEMTFWASITAFNCWGGTPTIGQGCGPYPSTQAYGGAIHDQLRGDAWTLRNRAETAFAEPDGTPEKSYFTALTDEAIARWEGGFGLTGTSFDGTPEKAWGQKVGNEQTTNAGPFTGQVPPLKEWGSICDPTLAYTACINDPQWLNTTTGGFSDPWMQWYVQYAIGRAAELGFPMQAINGMSALFPIGMILDSGMPTLVGYYEDGPLGSGRTGWYSTWASWMTSLNLTPNCCGGGGFPAYFMDNIASDGREVWLTPGLAMTVDQNQPRAAQAWAWFKANVYSKVPDFANDPKWAIVPRTDTNVLPAQPL